MTEDRKFDRQEFYKQYRDKLSQRLDSQGVRWWKPKVGTNVIRILPSWKGRQFEFFKLAYVHWNVGENQNKVTCPTTEGKDNFCPICAYVEELYNSGLDEDVIEAKKIVRKERYACNILDRSGQTEGVAVYEMGPKLFRDILFLFTDGDYGEVDDPKVGRDIKIVREGTGLLDTKYSPYPAAKESQIDEKLLNDVFDLDVVYKPMTGEEIEAVLVGDAEERTTVGVPAESPDEAVNQQFVEKLPPPAPVEEKKETAPPVEEKKESPPPVEEKKEPVPPVEEKKETAPEVPKEEVKEATPPPSPPREEAKEDVSKSVQSERGAKLRERIQKLRAERTTK